MENNYHCLSWRNADSCFPFTVWIWYVRETSCLWIWKRIHMILTKAVSQLQFPSARKSPASCHFKLCKSMIIHSFHNLTLTYMQMFSHLHCSIAKASSVCISAFLSLTSQFLLCFSIHHHLMWRELFSGETDMIHHFTLGKFSLLQ